jgi:hypothetical protein
MISFVLFSPLKIFTQYLARHFDDAGNNHFLLRDVDRSFFSEGEYRVEGERKGKIKKTTVLFLSSFQKRRFSTK